MSGFLVLLLERRAGALVARLTIERPEKRNALGRAALAELADALRGISADSSVRAVVLTGAGEQAFAGGADVAELAALDASSAREFITRVHEACAALRECPVPVVARVNGIALGVGLELAAACDLRIAAQGARFGMPEVRLGVPSVVEAALLPRLVGAGRARWLVLTGETIDAREALAWGLVERVVPGAELDTAVDAALDAILASGAEAVRTQKRLCKLWEEAPLSESVRASIDAFAASYASGEPQRLIGAYLAQRAKERGA
ncbi:MAG TPA: enoyl-CoA hydratase [Burkholderiales bacterium]|nr:enoyl-CoA hydratase [Burkholderiales bacterium]